MLFEHWIYSTAIAIIAGMIHFRRTGRDYSWIIIASAYAPDIDMFAGAILDKLGRPFFFEVHPIRHGDFHNIAVLVIYAILAALVLLAIRYRFRESLLFAGVGFGAHIFEDALIANPAYAFFWPISDQRSGIGLMEFKPDFIFIIDSSVLLTGLFFLLVCAFIRARYQGYDWVKKDLKATGIILFAWILMVPALIAFDGSVPDKIMNTRDGVHLENWIMGNNTSWDTTVYHSISHSGKVEITGNESKISGVFRSKEIPVKPNMTYFFSSWGKTNNANGTNAPAVRIVELNGSKKGIKQTNIIFNKGTNDWAQKNVSFITNSSTSWIYVYANIWKGYGTFWFDDVELYEKGYETNLIPDPGIENGYVIEELIEFRKIMSS